MRPETEKGTSMVDSISQSYALKSGGGFARLADVFATPA
jgi:hypothetical protein